MRTPEFGLIYHFLARVMDPSPSGADLLSELRGMHPLDRGPAVALMTTVARNLGSRTMWESQFKLLCEGKPSFVTVQSSAGGGHGRWAGVTGGGVDVGGGLFRAPSGGGGDVAAAERQGPPLPQPGVYSRPFLAEGPAAAAPAPPPGAGVSGESAAAEPGPASDEELPLLVLPPQADADAAAPELSPLESLDAMLAAPPPPVKAEEAADGGG